MSDLPDNVVRRLPDNVVGPRRDFAAEVPEGSPWERLKQAISGEARLVEAGPPSMWERLKRGSLAGAEMITRGNLLGLPGDSALEASAKMPGAAPPLPFFGPDSWINQGAQDRFRPGMKMGEMIAPNWQENPMLAAFGEGGISRAGMRPPPSAGRLADFEAQGVSPSVPTIGQTRATGLSTRVGGALPASPVGSGLARNVEEVAAAAEQRASQFGTASADAGGPIAQNALKRFEADKTLTNQKYNEFWQEMQGAPPAPVNNSLRVLNDIHGRFPSAPELEGLFTNPKLNQMRQAMTPRTVTTPGTTSPILNQYGLPSTVTPATSVQRGGSLSIPELRELRTQVGYLLEKPPAEIPRAQLKQLYGGLSADLRAAAAAQGPDAAKALAVADATFAKRMTMMDQLSALVNRDAPEAVFGALTRAASEGAGGHASLLRAAREAMGPQDWSDMGASMIRRLGNPRPGMPRDPAVPEFSVDTFAVNWQKMSPKAKEVLFGPDTPGTPRSGLEQLGRVAADVRNAQRLSGPASHRHFTSGAILTELVMRAGMGHMPIPELATLTGAYGISKLLMTPWFARAAYAPESALRETIAGTGRSTVVNQAILEGGQEAAAMQREQQEQREAPRASVAGP